MYLNKNKVSGRKFAENLKANFGDDAKKLIILEAEAKRASEEFLETKVYDIAADMIKKNAPKIDKAIREQKIDKDDLTDMLWGMADQLLDYDEAIKINDLWARYWDERKAYVQKIADAYSGLTVYDITTDILGLPHKDKTKVSKEALYYGGFAPGRAFNEMMNSKARELNVNLHAGGATWKTIFDPSSEPTQLMLLETYVSKKYPEINYDYDFYNGGPYSESKKDWNDFVKKYNIDMS